MIYAVIMAGGSGTRFWPKSTKSLPKQFQSLFGEGTMIQNTAKRIEPIIPQERILVVTNAGYVDIVNEQLPKVPSENIVGEPVAKNTAPCVAIAAEMLYKKDPEAVMVVLPADHHITEPEKFNTYLKTAVEKAQQEQCLVTLGITPDRPETGYGYIQSDDAKEEKLSGNSVQLVQAFKEKPDVATAQQFLDEGNYFWNSGMFIWTAESILAEFEQHLPKMFEQVKEAGASLYGENHTKAIHTFYHACESVSIDYGIMEHAKNVYVVPGQFGWNDVGSWTAAYELEDKDADGNVVKSDYATFSKSAQNYISSKSGKMISVVGLDGIAVVETDDAILVCKIDEAQNVKEIVEQLKKDDDLSKFA